MDLTAIGSTFGFGKAVSYFLDKVGSPAASGTYELVAGGVGSVLALVKFIATNILLDRTITLVDGPPLERTKNRTPGKQRQLEATLKMTTGNGQLFNCFRIMFNAAGQDFSLPNDGPAEGAELTWHVESGPVQFTSQGSGANPVVTRTGSDGKSTTGIEGMPQKQDLPDSVSPITKRAVVYITIALKPSVWYKDLIDAVGVATAGLDAPVQLINNLLDRIGSRGARLTFAVTDWAHDYKFAYTASNGVTFAGGVCDGPTGQWKAQVTGSTQVSDVKGSFTIDMSQTGNVGSTTVRGA